MSPSHCLPVLLVATALPAQADAEASAVKLWPQLTPGITHHANRLAMKCEVAADGVTVTDAAWDISREILLDRIYGGWVGMLIGGIEGLPHEFKYKEQPRDTLPEFTFLEKGARSDDDNDIE